MVSDVLSFLYVFGLNSAGQALAFVSHLMRVNPPHRGRSDLASDAFL